MANHLDRSIYDKKSSTGAITNFLDKPGHFKPLDRNSLTSAHLFDATNTITTKETVSLGLAALVYT
ncbi:hypothetical protein MJO28_011947, partial [Puccinia striiformis f. sp. tritici]